MFWRLWKKRRTVKNDSGYITIVYDPGGTPILIHDSLSQASALQVETTTEASSSHAEPSDIYPSVFDADWEMETVSPPLQGLWDSGPDSFGISIFMD